MHTSQKQHQSLAFMTQLALYAKNTVKTASNPTLKYAHTVALLLCILLSDGLKSAP